MPEEAQDDLRDLFECVQTAKNTMLEKVAMRYAPTQEMGVSEAVSVVVQGSVQIACHYYRTRFRYRFFR